MAPTIHELEIEVDALKDTIGEIKTILVRLEEKLIGSQTPSNLLISISNNRSTIIGPIKMNDWK